MKCAGWCFVSNWKGIRYVAAIDVSITACIALYNDRCFREKTRTFCNDSEHKTKLRAVTILAQVKDKRKQEKIYVSQQNKKQSKDYQNIGEGQGGIEKNNISIQNMIND